MWTEIRTYVRECWGMAVSVRERQKSMMGLFAAFTALPIILALGGKLEWSRDGFLWAAAWAFVTAVIYLFVVSPFLVWREGRRLAQSQIAMRDDAIRAALDTTDAVEAIGECYRHGLTIYNREFDLGDDQANARWRADIESWGQSVEALLRRFWTANDLNRFVAATSSSVPRPKPVDDARWRDWWAANEPLLVRFSSRLDVVRDVANHDTAPLIVAKERLRAVVGQR